MSLNLGDIELYTNLNTEINNILAKYINLEGISGHTKKDLENIKLIINCASNSKINMDSKKNEDALIDEDALKCANSEIITEYHRLIQNIDNMKKIAKVPKDALNDKFIAEFRHDFFLLSMVTNRLDILYYLRQNYLKTTNFHRIKE